MHFTQIFAAILALPALGMTAAVPLQPRQAINRPCTGFNFLSVGALTISNNLEFRNYDAVIQLKPEGAGEASWQTKAFIKKGTKNVVFDVNGNTGVKHLRVCKADFSGRNPCHFPVANNANMRWDFKISGDRWHFAIDVIDGSDEDIQGVCGVSTEKVNYIPQITTSQPPTTTTTTQTRTSTSTSTKTTSTRTSTTTTRTSTRSSSTSARSTSTRRN